MFDQLFKKPRVLARYRDGPLAEERRRYLVHCAEQRMARSTLREIAIYTFGVAKALRLAERPGEFITSGEIKAAADCWVRRRSPQRSLPTVSTAWRLFTRFATRWLSFLGRLQPVITASQPYLGQVTAFADHMRQERGLSPRTIEICCRTACEFLAQLSEAGLRLDTLTIPQVDDIVARQIREGGYARVTVRGYVSRLRAFFRYAEACAWCCQGLAVALVAPRLFRDESLPSGPSWEDVKRLLAATQGHQPADIRARAVLMLLAVYGLRAGEVVELAPGGLRLGARVAHRPVRKATTAADLPVVPSGRRCRPALPSGGASPVAPAGGVSQPPRAVRATELLSLGVRGQAAVTRLGRDVAALRPACSPPRLRHPFAGARPVTEGDRRSPRARGPRDDPALRQSRSGRIASRRGF